MSVSSSKPKVAYIWAPFPVIKVQWVYCERRQKHRRKPDIIFALLAVQISQSTATQVKESLPWPMGRNDIFGVRGGKKWGKYHVNRLVSFKERKAPFLGGHPSRVAFNGSIFLPQKSFKRYFVSGYFLWMLLFFIADIKKVEKRNKSSYLPSQNQCFRKKWLWVLFRNHLLIWRYNWQCICDLAKRHSLNWNTFFLPVEIQLSVMETTHHNIWDGASKLIYSPQDQ